MKMPDYYAGSDAYRRMLEAQPATVFDAYVGLFERFVAPGATVLDVGCGTGDSTMRLRNQGFDAVGTDVSPRFLPDAEGFLALDFTAADDLPPDRFGGAGALNVLEHVEDPKRFLRQLVRVVVPGGYVVLLSPNLTSPLVGLRTFADVSRGRPAYTGVRGRREALALLGRNIVRSVGSALGRDVFERRAPRLDVVGRDADAVYWTNAAEVRRALERSGCEIVLFQGAGRSRAARALARVAPSLAGQLRVVARKRPAAAG
jgi:SAM-dependent methyltransferase